MALSQRVLPSHGFHTGLKSQTVTKNPPTQAGLLHTARAIDFPKMFRVALGRLGAEHFTVARHQHRDLTGRLSKIKQGAVNFCL